MIPVPLANWLQEQVGGSAPAAPAASPPAAERPSASDAASAKVASMTDEQKRQAIRDQLAAILG